MIIYVFEQKMGDIIRGAHHLEQTIASIVNPPSPPRRDVIWR